MTLINKDSFIPTGEIVADGIEEGTVEVTLRNITKRVSARRTYLTGESKAERIIAYDMFGKYKTGVTKWPARIRLELNNNRESVYFGRDDRCPKFRKENNIWFNN